MEFLPRGASSLSRAGIFPIRGGKLCRTRIKECAEEDHKDTRDEETAAADTAREISSATLCIKCPSLLCNPEWCAKKYGSFSTWLSPASEESCDAVAVVRCSPCLLVLPKYCKVRLTLPRNLLVMSHYWQGSLFFFGVRLCFVLCVRCQNIWQINWHVAIRLIWEHPKFI